MGNDGAEPVEPAAGEERAVVVSDVTRDVADGAVDEHCWSFRSGRPHAQESHDVASTTAIASISTSNPSGSPT